MDKIQSSNVKLTLGKKKVVLFLEMNRVKIFFYHLPARKVKCVSEHFFFQKKKKHTNKKQKKLKKKREYLWKI